VRARYEGKSAAPNGQIMRSLANTEMSVSALIFRTTVSLRRLCFWTAPHPWTGLLAFLRRTGADGGLSGFGKKTLEAEKA
jgi:hypothetical protein